jgi:hypothetical protein
VAARLLALPLTSRLFSDPTVSSCVGLFRGFFQNIFGTSKYAPAASAAGHSLDYASFEHAVGLLNLFLEDRQSLAIFASLDRECTGGVTVGDMVRGLMEAVDPDVEPLQPGRQRRDGRPVQGRGAAWESRAGSLRASNSQSAVRGPTGGHLKSTRFH